MDIKEAHWAAGFLEGEGYFPITARMSIRACQVNPEPLYRLQRLLGGRILGPYTPKNRKAQPFFRWDLNGTNGAAVMMTLYSLMSEKRKASIAAALRIWKVAPGNPNVWLARGTCKNGHDITGNNYVVAPSGHGRCRQCGIDGRRRYYKKHKEKWRGYAAKQRAALADVISLR